MNQQPDLNELTITLRSNEHTDVIKLCCHSWPLYSYISVAKCSSLHYFLSLSVWSRIALKWANQKDVQDHLGLVKWLPWLITWRVHHVCDWPSLCQWMRRATLSFHRWGAMKVAQLTTINCSDLLRTCKDAEDTFTPGPTVETDTPMFASWTIWRKYFIVRTHSEMTRFDWLSFSQESSLKRSVANMLPHFYPKSDLIKRCLTSGVRNASYVLSC